MSDSPTPLTYQKRIVCDILPSGEIKVTFKTVTGSLPVTQPELPKILRAIRFQYSHYRREFMLKSHLDAPKGAGVSSATAS